MKFGLREIEEGAKEISEKVSNSKHLAYINPTVLLNYTTGELLKI